MTQTIGQIFIASLAGYGLARIPYRWANQVFYAMLMTLMIPGAVTFVPLFVLVSAARLGEYAAGPDRAEPVQHLRGLPVPAVLSELPARAGGGGPA